jgi:hypothetical protein
MVGYLFAQTATCNCQDRSRSIVGETGETDTPTNHFWILLHQMEGYEYTSLRMILRTRLYVVAALLALLGMPGLSCFVPQLMGAGENECCRQMGSQCGSKEMSSPQSCCKSPSQQSIQPYIGSGEHSRIVPATVVTVFLPVDSVQIFLVADSALTIAQFHSPPLSLSETNSVLRI